MKAYQRVIREQKEQEPPDNLFGDWWKGVDLDLKKTVIKECSYETAKKIVLEYEWMGRMPALVLQTYGIFFRDNCGGAVVFSPDYGENLGVWDKYGFSSKIILLARGACVHWSPSGAASRLIRKSMSLLPSQYEVITATVDSYAGEVGTIYQACGFHYVGVMHKEDSHRFGVQINGKLIGARSMRHKLGHYRREDVLKTFPGAVILPQTVKARYFCFRGPNQKQHLQAIKHLIQPYPKR